MMRHDIARRVLPVVLALVTFGLDVLSKTWAERALAPGEPVPVGGDALRLTLGYNSGVAFSLFPEVGLAWLLVAGPLTLGLVGWLFQEARRASPGVWPLSLLLGGALGNVWDRASDGRVTDVVDIGIGTSRWPTFNLADVALSLALVLIAWWLLGDASDSSETARAPRQGGDERS